MTEQTPAPSTPAPSTTPAAPNAAVQVAPTMGAGTAVITVDTIQSKIAFVEALGVSIKKDTANAPAEVRAHFELVESRLVTFVKTHLGYSFLADAAVAFFVGAVIAHVFR